MWAAVCFRSASDNTACPKLTKCDDCDVPNNKLSMYGKCQTWFRLSLVSIPITEQYHWWLIHSKCSYGHYDNIIKGCKSFYFPFHTHKVPNCLICGNEAISLINPDVDILVILMSRIPTMWTAIANREKWNVDNTFALYLLAEQENASREFQETPKRWHPRSGKVCNENTYNSPNKDAKFEPKTL